MTTTRNVTVTFPLREQIQLITYAEHNLLLNHPSHADAADFLSAQYTLPMDTAQAIVKAIRAVPPAITRLVDRKVEVLYTGAEYTMEITYAEYNLIPTLSTVQGTKFLRDQYSLGLYEAKRCCDAIRAAHKV